MPGFADVLYSLACGLKDWKQRDWHSVLRLSVPICCGQMSKNAKKCSFWGYEGGSARYSFGQGFINFFPPIDPDFMRSALHLLEALYK